MDYSQYPFSLDDDLAAISDTHLQHRLQAALSERWNWMVQSSIGVVSMIAGLGAGVAMIINGSLWFGAGLLCIAAFGAWAHYPFSKIVSEYQRLRAERDRRERAQIGIATLGSVE